jgi:tRNA-specific 2-thiouridylase
MKSQGKKVVDPERSRRVFVGLSGGVDSAVSAALLKQQGFDVTGVFIKAWSPPGFVCTWKEDRRSAMRAAAVLDIPFLTLDLEKEYKQEVVDYMIKEYREGKTPNPDVMCNKQIKFGHFLKFALRNGADYVATGHYARKVVSSQQPASRDKKENVETLMLDAKCLLLEGTDSNKDQSYFLWTLTEDQLKHTLFPIGHLEKPEVRKLAHKFGLPQETRKDSQGLCFLGKIDMKEFLKEYLDVKKGDVVSENGEVIGEHDGAELYTLGERHGFNIFKQTGEPVYVVGKDVEKNTITVAGKYNFDEKNETADQESSFSENSEGGAVQKSPTKKVWLSQRRGTEDFLRRSFSEQQNICKIKNQNWILGEEPKGEIECRLRYRQTKIKCRVEGDNLFLPEGEVVAPGQSVVFYGSASSAGGSEICLGGAIIAE